MKNSTKLAEYPKLSKVLVPTYCIIIFVLVPPLTDAIGQQPDDEPPLTSRSIFSIQPWRYYLSRQWKWSPFTSILDAIIDTVLNRLQSDRKMKNLIRIPWYRLSYSVINVDIADLASFHYITPRPSSTLFCCTSIAHTMDNIMRYNYVQDWTSTDRYWWSYGIVKFSARIDCNASRRRKYETYAIR